MRRRQRVQTDSALLLSEEAKEIRTVAPPILRTRSSASSGSGGSPAGSGNVPRRRLSWQEDLSSQVVQGAGCSASSTSPASAGSGGSPRSPSARGPRTGRFGVPSDPMMVTRAMTEPAASTKRKIDDRRSMPSSADHNKIVNSFTQGLASVESVIVYDVNEQEWEVDHDSQRKAKPSALGMTFNHCFPRLGAICSCFGFLGQGACVRQPVFLH